ncbi:MAG: Na+/H+ antiporter NhaA [Pseudomonadota bacterium]
MTSGTHRKRPVEAFSAAIREFIEKESAAGFLLAGATIAALIFSNTPLSGLYAGFLSTKASVSIGALAIDKPLVLWINDGLMAIFFFLIGLEVKREILEGELSSWESAALPVFAAIGGMAAPALIFLAVVSPDNEAMRGWAIPAATDIAFALGVLAVLGARVPAALKVFLLAVAIIDDLGAILIIALFYTADLSLIALVLALVGVGGLVGLNRSRVMARTPYLLLGVFIWVCVLKSGVHATLAGVVTALAIPLKGQDGTSPLKDLEHSLHPWIAFAILPVFAFANAGIDLRGLSVDAVIAPLPLGIALGLFVGKQIGVFGIAFVALKMGLAKRPASLSYWHLYGAACLTGIGFTMSLFIGSLAFTTEAAINEVRLGVLIGSLASGLLGYAILVRAKQTSIPEVTSEDKNLRTIQTVEVKAKVADTAAAV